MVIISAILSIADVVVKATTLLSRLPENWYRAGSEIEKFKSDLSILSRTSAQWENQPKQLGISENPLYNTLLAEAVRLLEAEEDFYDKHQKSWYRKRRRKDFPSQLAHILLNVRQIVQADPELQKKSAEWQELLTKSFLMNPSPLPFGHDRKYVPLQKMVDEVRRAVEDTEAPQVVTLHGEPGIGKSSLAKYVALLYQESICASSCSFFDGVQYLYCGQGCRNSIHQLRKTFLSNLGLNTMTAAANEGEQGVWTLSSYQSLLRRLLSDRSLLIVLDDVWVEDFDALTNFVCQGTSCRYLLTSQSRDIWHKAQCIQMETPNEGKALKIFQNHLQCSGQLQGCLNSSPLGESSSISYPEEFSGRNELQGSSSRAPVLLCAPYVKETYEMIRKLNYHPLSLINVAVCMNHYSAIDSKEWKSLVQNILHFIDENYPAGLIYVYERPYSLSLRASMMLMVEPLRETERNLFFLIALLEDRENGISLHLIRFFIRRLCQNQSSQSTFIYLSALKYLEDNSLVHKGFFSQNFPNYSVDSVEVNSMSWTVNRLRREYIREKQLPALRSIVSGLLGTRGDDDHLSGSLVNVRDNDQCLAVMAGVVFFDDALTDEVAPQFQSIMTQMMDKDRVPQVLKQKGLSRTSAMSGPRSVVPRGPRQWLDARQLEKGVKHACREGGSPIAINMIMEMLNLEGEEQWKQQVHEDASKIMMKLVCKWELDDASMASLLTIPYTTDVACQIFSYIYNEVFKLTLQHAFYYGQRKSLSDVLPATWRALSSLLLDHGKDLRGTTHLYGHLHAVISSMLEFESESTLLVQLQNLCERASQSPVPDFQDAVHSAFIDLHISRLSSELLSGLDLEEYLPTIVWKLFNGERHGRLELDRMYEEANWLRLVWVEYMRSGSVYRLKWDRGYIKILLRFPVPCKEWLTNATLLRHLLRVEKSSELPEGLLAVLSGTPEFRAEAARTLTRDSGGSGQEDFTLWPESFGDRLARFWGNVALVQDFDDSTRLRLVIMAKHWAIKLSEYNSGDIVCSCTCSCPNKDCTCSADEKSISIDSIEEVARTVTIINHYHANSALVDAALEGSQGRWTDSKCLRCVSQGWEFYVRACQGQAQAYHQMQMYAEALRCLDLARQACHAITPGVFKACSTRYSMEYNPNFAEDELRAYVMLVKALLNDHVGAMDALQQLEQGESAWWKTKNAAWQLWICGNRAVLFRLSGEFSKAIHAFDKALQHWERMTSEREYVEWNPRPHNFLKIRLLEHCGYTRHLMGDLEGSKVDMESATNLRSHKLFLEPVSWSYFSEWEYTYSLLQLEVH